MTIPIGIQLYSLREEVAQNYEKVLSQVADMGCSVVELHDSTAPGLPELLQKYNLKAPSMHSQLPKKDELNKLIDTAKGLGVEYIVTGIPPKFKDAFISLDTIKETADLYNEIIPLVQDAGLKLGYHNHAFEFEDIEGKPGIEHFLENVSDDLLLELDTYWIRAAEKNVPEAIEKHGHRTPLFHIKDGTFPKGQPFLALGDGEMNIPEALEAAKPYAKYFIIELDNCATDMLEAVTKSYNYLTK